MITIAILIVGVLIYVLGRFVHKSNERDLLFKLKASSELCEDRDLAIVLLKIDMESQAARIAELEAAANAAHKSLVECFEVKT